MLTRVLVVALCPVALALAAHAASEIDSHSAKVEEKINPSRVEFRFRLTEPDAIESVEAKAGDQALQTEFRPFAKDEQTSTAFLFLIDKSDRKRAKTVQANKALILRLLERDEPRVQFAVYDFASELQPLAEFGSTKTDIRAALKTFEANGVATELYRNCIEAIKVLEKTDAARKALVLMSDGRAEDTSFDVGQVLERARDAGVTIFSVGYPEKAQLKTYLQGMRRLAEESGGEFVEADIVTKKEPDSFTRNLFPLMKSGGVATAELTNQPAGAEVQFAVHTKSERLLNFGYKLAAQSAPAATPQLEAPSAPQMTPAIQTAADATPAPQPENTPGAEASAAPTASAMPVAAAVTPAVPETSATPAPVDSPTAQPHLTGMPNPAIAAAEASAAEGPAGSKDEKKSKVLWLEALGILLLAGIAIVWKARRRPGADATAAGSKGYAKLQVLGTDGAEYVVRTTAVRLGRGRDNDFVLHNDSISRHHAEIHRKRDGNFTITDLGAGNGVLLNEKKVEQGELKHEDIIELGEVRMRFVVL